MEKKKTSSICLKPFLRKDNLERHNTLIKCKPPVGDEINGSFKCDICLKNFASKRKLQRHKSEVKCKAPVEDENRKRYECRVCQKPFLSINGRRKHERKHGYNPEYNQTIKCSECLEVFHTSKKILNHYKCHPHIKLKTDSITFQNEEEFKTWKTYMEEKTSSCYSTRTSFANSNGRVHQYICHRSGVHQSKANKRLNTSTVKSGYFCPSQIIATTLPCGKIEVEFTQPHVGHRCELHKLRLDDETKAELAGLLQSGLSFDTILEKIAEEADPKKRLYLTKRQDLRNLCASFGVKKVQQLTSLCRGKTKKNTTALKRRKVPAKSKDQIHRCDDADRLDRTYQTYRDDAGWCDSEKSKESGKVLVKVSSETQTYRMDRFYRCNDAGWLVPIHSSEVFCTSSSDEGDLMVAADSPAGSVNSDEEEVDAAVQGINEPQYPESNLDYLKEQAKAAVSSLIPDIDSFTGEEQCKALLKFIKMAKENRLSSKKRKNAGSRNKLRK